MFGFGGETFEDTRVQRETPVHFWLMYVLTHSDVRRANLRSKFEVIVEFKSMNSWETRELVASSTRCQKRFVSAREHRSVYGQRAPPCRMRMLCTPMEDLFLSTAAQRTISLIPCSCEIIRWFPQMMSALI